jgi:Rieske Fe-S protein
MQNIANELGSHDLHSRARQDSRRSFLKWMTHGLGALFGVLLGIPALAYLVDARNRPAPKRGMRRVARLKELEIGKPKQVVIYDTRQDAWTLHPNDVVGRVWLVRQDENRVDAFTTICPHLGCSVDWRPDQGEKGLFICPCHNGTFDPKGELFNRPSMENPAPRGMDKLELAMVADSATPDNPFLEVSYENFQQGQHEKTARK